MEGSNSLPSWRGPAKRLLALVAYTQLWACAALAPQIRLQPSAERISIARPALYPETIEANPRGKGFLVSSVREGAVYEVGLDGVATRLVQDDRLTSILGIAVDPRSGRLFVTNADIGAGMRRSARGARKEAGVGIYELATGRALHYVDLSPLVPDGEHLTNGITVDDQGNAYVTDSFSPAIYKIDRHGKASVFLSDREFQGEAVNLNGIVYHPDGFLLVVKKSTGALYRIPRDSPRAFERVRIGRDFQGGDGLMLVGERSLVMIANKTSASAANAAFVLRSDDGWESASLMQTASLGEVYPTTCTALADRIYVLASHLDEWLGAAAGSREQIIQRGRTAEIRELGAIFMGTDEAKLTASGTTPAP